MKNQEIVWTLDKEIQSRAGPHETTQANNVELIRGQLYYVAVGDILLHVDIAKVVTDLESGTLGDCYFKTIDSNVSDLCCDGSANRVYYNTIKGEVGYNGKKIGKTQLEIPNQEYLCMAKHKIYLIMVSCLKSMPKENIVELFSTSGKYLHNLQSFEVKDGSYKQPKHAKLFSSNRIIFGIVSRMTDELYMICILRQKLHLIESTIKSHNNGGCQSIYGFFVNHRRGQKRVFDILIYGYDTLVSVRCSFN